jgi:fibronectin-binding autotransporter adhesin
MCSFVRMTETGFGAVIWGWFAYGHGKTLVGGTLMSSIKTTSRMAAISLAFVVGLLAMTPGAALAQTNGVWLATTGGAWGTASNWTSNQIASGVSGSANFTSSITGIQVVTLDDDRTIGAIRLGSGGGANIFSLQMGTSGTLTLATSSGSPTLDVQSSRSGIIGASLAGSQGFAKVGAGTLYLGGTSIYSGQTSISAGTLEVATAGALGATGDGNETVVSSGARLRIGATVTVNESIFLNGAGSTGALNFGSSQPGVNVSAATMAGLVTLQSAATIGVSGGSYGIMDRSGAGDAINNNGSALTIQNSGSIEVRSPISGAGSLTVSGNGQLVLTAANTYTGTTGWTAATGNLWLGDGGTGGSLSTSSVITLSNPNAKFGVNQSDTVTQGIDFSGSAINGDGIFTQAGSGTTILNAANSYAGATLVNAGKLLINGNQSAATGAVTVAAGATLGGSGTTGGAVTVNGGILSPGNSPGVLTVASVALNASSTSLFEVNGTTRGTQYDGLDITGVNGVTYDGALSLSFGNGSSFADNTTFDLFSFSGTPSGNFSSVTSTGYYAGTWTQAAGEWSLTTSEQKLTFTPSTGDLVIAVPEPATLGLLSGLAVVGFFARRQRGVRG